MRFLALISTLYVLGLSHFRQGNPDSMSEDGAMRLLSISRSHYTALTKGRWGLVPTWRTHLPQRFEFWSSQAVSVVQNPSPWQANDATDTSSPNLSLLRYVNVKPEPHSQRPPNELLNKALKVHRAPGVNLGESDLADLRYLARRTSIQLSVVTGQHILRQTAELNPSIKTLLCNDNEWKIILSRLEGNGYTEDDLQHWAWILTPDSPDERADRFLSKACHKPLFVLFNILKTAPLSRPDAVHAILQYCQKWYSGRQDAYNSVGRTSKGNVGVNLETYSTLLLNLCRHVRRLQPHSLLDVANLASTYIREVSKSKFGDSDRGYSMQCRVFNSALQALSLAPRVAPYANRAQNWRAQKALLSFSSSLERPLVIEQESYRALRQVFLGLPKTKAERDTATALASSWPPYRVSRNGMEEKAGPEEYLSRAVKAGIMMQEAGYSKQKIDLIMDIIGGLAPDDSPTIQMRAVYRRRSRRREDSWIALIRTTRNPEEAWARFKKPPEPGMKPTFGVYWQLFTKLVSMPVKPGHDNLPGDGRETFPYDDMNLSEFEKARTSPPSIHNLVEQMLKSGVKITGQMLGLLIRLAPTINDALDYINHSVIEGDLKKHLRQCLWNYEDIPPPVLDKLPGTLLHACIQLLCRLQPNRAERISSHTSTLNFDRVLYRIHFAIRLAQLGSTRRGKGRPERWESILAALSRPGIMICNAMPKDHELQVLSMANMVMEKAEAHCGLNLAMFSSYAKVITKAISPRLPDLLNDTSNTRPEEVKDLLSLYDSEVKLCSFPEQPAFKRVPPNKLSWHRLLTPIFRDQSSENPQAACAAVRDASKKLKAAWRALSTIGPAGEPGVNFLVMVTHILNYMRALAFLGETEEMALLLWWVVREWSPEGGKSLDFSHRKALRWPMWTFRAFAEPMLDSEAVAALRDEIERRSAKDDQFPVYWPSDEEVEDFVLGDPWGNNQNLREVLRLATELGEQKQQPVA